MLKGYNSFMDTRQKLETALKDAMRSGNDLRKQAVRLVMSTVKLTEVEKGTPLDEAGILAVLQKEIKSRHEAIADADKANRPDLAAKAQDEIAFLETFLPKQLSAEEITALAREAVQEVGATQPADMGKVMKALLPKVQGRAPGDQVSQAVRKLLQS